MKMISFLEVMTKLSVVPGLGFLNQWVGDYRRSHSQMFQRIGDFQNYYGAAREGVSDVRGAFSDDDSGRLLPIDHGRSSAG